MNRMTDNDRNWGPFTLARWRKRIAIEIESGDDEDPESCFRVMGFGWALRVRVPGWLIRPYKEKKTAVYWDEATIARHGKNWYYQIHPREFGVALSDIGNGYDFLQVHFGRQTHDSSTSRSWCKHFPWKQWRCVRWSVYAPDGTHFATEPKGKFFEFCRTKDECPQSYFAFEDYDGTPLVASCRIEEREWHRGEGWFKWLRWFYRPMVRRCLNLDFSGETGPGKGSWKGGTLGHGIEMQEGETPQQAFERYCANEQSHKGRKYQLKFIGPSGPPEKKVVP
jgi:hypothetical protein